MNIKRFEDLEIWQEGRELCKIVYDNKYITEEKLNEMLARTDSLSRKTFNLMQYLKNSDFKGLKYL